jgi:hypothetical protein
MLISCLAYSSTMKMKVTCSSETSVDFQRIIWPDISQKIEPPFQINLSNLIINVRLSITS